MTSVRYRSSPFPRRVPVHSVVARSRKTPSTPRDRFRRGLNVAVASLGIVMATPLMLLIALAIWFTSKGPILYRQTRIGVNRRRGAWGQGPVCRRRGDTGGQPFTIFKFRTMYVEDGAEAAQVWALPDDPRITPVGRVLRRFRLDELPQLINVLRGEMNLVGPRPEQPEIFAALRQQLGQYEERQQVLPGITGWAQIRHHYDTSVEDVRKKVEFDLEYISRCSASEDAKIMLMTLPVMIFRRGAL